MITKQNEIVKGKITFIEIHLSINDKLVSIEIEQPASIDYDMSLDTNYTFIEGEELLSDEEKDEIDDFIRENY